MHWHRIASFTTGLSTAAALFSIASTGRAAQLTARDVRGDGGQAMCLGARDGEGDGSSVALWSCDNSLDQRFVFDATTGEIRSALGDRSTWCLDVNGGEAFAGNEVQLWSCNGSAAQKFSYRARSGELR